MGINRDYLSTFRLCTFQDHPKTKNAAEKIIPNIGLEQKLNSTEKGFKILVFSFIR